MKNNLKAPSRIGFLANTEKPASRDAVLAAAEIVRRTGKRVLTEQATAKLVGLTQDVLATPAELARNCDLLLVFGGDGTILRAAKEIHTATTPLVGINLGGLGFLTAIGATEVPQLLPRVLAGEFELEPRPLLAATDGAKPFLALNDFVLSRKADPRLVEIDVFVDGQEVTRYRCDGLIISSPTGSTAYSLSAGGAIVTPDAEVFTLTPICPHTLSNRSIVISLNSKISIRAASRVPELMLAGDGERVMDVPLGATVHISRSEHCVRLVRLPNTSFFQTLRQKLQWSGSHV